MNILNDGLLLRDPLRIMDHDNKEKTLNSSLGVIVARAGTGKTALIVQLSIETIFQNNNVLHVSLSEPIDKVSTWYNEVLNNLVALYDLDDKIGLRESIQSRRFIMTFKVEKFSVPTLKERLKDLTEQQIFKPNVIIIDGLPFDNSITRSIKSLKTFSQQQHLHIWFTATTHRHEELTERGFPVQLNALDQLFDNIWQLEPKNKKVYIKSLKGNKRKHQDTQYFLDPSTMLVRSM